MVSIHINHGLQSAAEDMATTCAEVAQSLGVEHLTRNVAWGQDGISARPEHDNPTLEYSARIARYRTFFAAMSAVNAKSLVLGHHLDDQVETSIMRISKRSTEEGAGGMKFVRRWGMGFGGQSPNEDFGWTAYEGMRRWISRPLLEFPKDRLLATCEENRLEYVTDETNFVPHVTIRNAIRAWLRDKGSQTEGDQHKLRLDHLEKDLSHFESEVASMDLSGGLEQLYGAVMALNDSASDIESQVDSILSRCTLRSPPGTYLTTCNAISGIRDPKLQRAVVLRILRYMSFHPWGSLRAQIKRRNLGLTQISTKLWNPNPISPRIPEFCAGGGVQWSPVIIRGTTLRFSTHRPFKPMTLGENAGWLAFRQTPPKSESFIYQRKGIEDRLNVQVSRLMASNLEAGNTTLEYLYDCRFLITFDLTKLPPNIIRILRQPVEGEGLWLTPYAKWIWPRLVWRRPGQRDAELHAKITMKTPNSPFDDQLNLLSKPEVKWRDIQMAQAPWPPACVRPSAAAARMTCIVRREWDFPANIERLRRVCLPLWLASEDPARDSESSLGEVEETLTSTHPTLQDYTS
ncbi:hypothetical protein AAF712_005890 [Marasmius tenuissimus]|uniref:tRNA(Ile)-lysidine synthetase n=1 Tax=Marasmius tenuissimus TaxID=585030 RepID=A0ABR3A0E7_9AGAR